MKPQLFYVWWLDCDGEDTDYPLAYECSVFEAFSQEHAEERARNLELDVVPDEKVPEQVKGWTRNFRTFRMDPIELLAHGEVE